MPVEHAGKDDTRIPPRILSIAGSDSCGGAGIQADIKTATALGAYAMTAITAVTAQDTMGVHAVQLMPPELVRAQIVACLGDIGADAIKIGMLGSAAIVETVAEVLAQRAGGIPIVLDPVLISTSGTPLLDKAGVVVLKKKLLPLVALVTPNLPELNVLAPTGNPNELVSYGASAVLVKGGHGDGDVVSDRLYARDTVGYFEMPRLDTKDTHGTGCTYAMAIAVELAKTGMLFTAIARARAYVQEAIATAPGFGRGHGPLNFFRQEPRGDS